MTKKLFIEVFTVKISSIAIYLRIRRTVGLWKGYGFTKVATLGVTRGGKTLRCERDRFQKHDKKYKGERTQIGSGLTSE